MKNIATNKEATSTKTYRVRVVRNSIPETNLDVCFYYQRRYNASEDDAIQFHHHDDGWYQVIAGNESTIERCDSYFRCNSQFGNAEFPLHVNGKTYQVMIGGTIDIG